MKAHERAFEQWAGDEIEFAGLMGKTHYSRDEFENLCRQLIDESCKTTLPVLQEALNNLWTAAKRCRWSEDETRNTIRSILNPANLLRCRSIYEVKELLKNKAWSIENEYGGG